MLLYVIRHPQPLIASGICYGRSDIHAAPLSPAEIQAIHHQLPSEAQIFSSPLKRCARMAKQLFANRPIDYSPLLQEIDFGDWELTPWDQIPRVALDAWAANIEHFAPPGGESFAQLCDRVRQFIAGCDTSRDYVLVTHSGVIKALCCLLQQNTPASVASLNFPYQSITRFEFTHDTRQFTSNL